MTSADDHSATEEGPKEPNDRADSEVALEDSSATADAAPATAGGDERRRPCPSQPIAEGTLPDDFNPNEPIRDELLAMQPSSKKRRSDVQLTKDDRPKEGRAGGLDEDGDLNDEGGRRSDPFQRASEDVLKRRKIVRASGKWGSGGGAGGAASGGATFASVKLAPAAAKESGKDGAPPGSGDATSIFGSGAKLSFGSIGAAGSGFEGAAAKSGGFGAGFDGVSRGFGALKSSSSDKNDADNGAAPSKPIAFGGGFGAASAGFGSLKSSSASAGFGRAAAANATSSPPKTAAAGGGSGLVGTFAKSPAKSSSALPSKFPTSSVVDTANGEQDEDCLCQVRAKLFRMVPDDGTPGAAEEGGALKGDVPSVPSTSGRMELVKARKEYAEESPEKAGASPEKANDSAEGEDGDRPKLVQKEAGIGPVRVLKRKPPMTSAGEGGETAKGPMPSRVVQRQETSGGQATRVILNVRLVPKTCSVIRRGEKFVQLNAPNGDGTLESSLFKVKTTADADTLEKALQEMLEEPGP